VRVGDRSHGAELQLCDFLRERQLEIFRAWEERARGLSAAEHPSGPALRDHLPALLEHIANGVRAAGKQAPPAEAQAAYAFDRLAQGTDLVQVARELSLLREVIVELWGEARGGSPLLEEVVRFDVVLDDTIARSASALLLREMREAQEKMVLLQQLTGIVSHDLRNPLTAVTVAAESLLRSNLPEPITRRVVRIRTAAERALRLVRDLLDFTQARLGSGIPLHVTPSDLHRLVADIVEEARAGFPDREVQRSTEGDACGEWDPDRIAQVLQNLLGNALTYSPPGTAVAVRTRGEADTVVVEVHNDGPPIPQEHVPRLFEPFQRRDPSQGRAARNVGLGLFIVDEVVRAHRGSIEVRSSAQEGTTFSVRLPRLSEGPGEICKKKIADRVDLAARRSSPR
jgi:signal transduction histidine kinase